MKVQVGQAAGNCNAMNIDQTMITEARASATIR